MTIHTIEDATGYSHSQQEADAREQEADRRTDADAFSDYVDYLADRAFDHRPGESMRLSEDDEIRDFLTSRVRDVLWKVAKEAARLHTVVQAIER